MQVSFYGRLADGFGQRIWTLDTAPATGTALREELMATAPHMAELLQQAGTRLVVNEAIVDWASPLADSDAIAIIPIVSGG